MSLDPTKLSVEHKPLYAPSLQEIANVLKSSLASNYASVNVQVVDCPNLTEQPFTLASEGLGGSPRLVDIGGQPNLLPLVKREKVYDLKDLPQLTDLESATIIGTAAGPWSYAGVNSEAMINIRVGKNEVDQQTRIAKINPKDGATIQEVLPNTETTFTLLGNFFVSEGKPSKVLKVHVKNRTGNDDFVTSIRKSLANHYKDKIVGLGGTFLLKEGKAKQHIMPDFSSTPITSDEGFKEWLNFYDMSAPLIAIGTLVTGDYDLNLRMQHFHCFSHHGEGGHYHIDTTPEIVEYVGYFNVGEYIYRIDRPDLKKE